MGKLNPRPAPAATSASSRPSQQGPSKPQMPPPQNEPITHFLHAHPLRRTVFPAGYPVPICSGCEKPCPALVPLYRCTLCPSLTLDATCFAAPRTITHRAHPGHPLGLLATPPYPNRSFRCNACGEDGGAFCYHCTRCADFDLHVKCSRAPPKVVVAEHEDELELVFPDAAGSVAFLAFRCDVCGEEGSAGIWRYRCEGCDFDAHLGCALGETEGLNQNQEMPQPQAQRMRQRTTAGVSQQAPPLRPMGQNQHQAPWSTSQNQSEYQQQAPTPAWAATQQADPYEQILTQQREQTEKLMAFLNNYNAMQSRMTAELLQSYQRPPQLFGGLGVPGASSSPFPPYGSNGAVGASPYDALLQGFGGMSLNGNGGGAGGFGLGGGGGGDDQMSTLLNQMMGLQNQGGNPVVPSNLADLLGGSGTGGVDLTSLMGMFFS